MPAVCVRFFVVFAIFSSSLAGCVSTTSNTEDGRPQVGNPAIVSREINRLESGLQCFVRDPASSQYAMPSFGAFAFVRDGQLSSSAFARPDLARLIMASDNNLQKKARMLEYVRAVTKNDQQAIDLVTRVRNQAARCFQGVLDLRDDPQQRRLRSLSPGTLVNTGSRVATAGELVREFDEGYARVRRSRDISAQLYDNIILELRRGRTTESVFLAAVGPEPATVVPQAVAPQATQPVVPRVAQPPRVVAPNPPPPVLSDPLDNRFASLMNDFDEINSRGLVGG